MFKQVQSPYGPHLFVWKEEGQRAGLLVNLSWRRLEDNKTYKFPLKVLWWKVGWSVLRPECCNSTCWDFEKVALSWASSSPGHCLVICWESLFLSTLLCTLSHRTRMAAPSQMEVMPLRKTVVVTVHTPVLHHQGRRQKPKMQTS